MSEASEDTRVQIKGTFSVKKSDLNGLNKVAEYMNANRVERVPIVGYVEFVRHVDTVLGDEMTVALVAVEPAIEADGSDPHGRARQVRQVMEASRKGAGKTPIPDDLFTRSEDKQVDGQLEAIARGDVDGPPPSAGGMPTARSQAAGLDVFGPPIPDGERYPQEINLTDPPGASNASGDPVPEASGEEVMAEREEARAAEASVSRANKAEAQSAAIRRENGNRESGGLVTPGYIANAGTSTEGPQENVTPIRTPRTPRKKAAAAADPFKTGEATF